MLISSKLLPSLALLPACLSQSIEAIYLFKDVLSSNPTALKATNLNTVLLFNIEVHNTTDLFYPQRTETAETSHLVASNGKYVGGPDIANAMKNYKINSSIDRVEITLVSGYPTFENIRDIINSEGTGSDTVLYRNFAALKEAWDLDAINDDDEGVYDIPSTVAFAKMVGEMGYKFTGAPYRKQWFWKALIQQINAATPGLMDRIYLQCYDGGKGNHPGVWQEKLGMKVVPLLWVTNVAKPKKGKTVEQARVSFQGWKDQDMVAGGGYWNDYDIEKVSGVGGYEDYAGVLESIFG